MAAGQGADELAVTHDGELFAGWERVRGDVLSEKYLEGLASLENFFVGLKMLATRQTRYPGFLQVNVSEVVA